MYLSRMTQITTLEHEQASQDFAKAARHASKMRRDDLANHYLCQARMHAVPPDSCVTADYEIDVTVES